MLHLYRHRSTIVILLLINSLLNDKILNFQIEGICRRQNKSSVTQNLKFALGRVKKNIVEKGEMLLTNSFSFSNNGFRRLLIQGC